MWFYVFFVGLCCLGSGVGDGLVKGLGRLVVEADIDHLVAVGDPAVAGGDAVVGGGADNEGRQVGLLLSRSAGAAARRGSLGGLVGGPSGSGLGLLLVGHLGTLRAAALLAGI